MDIISTTSTRHFLLICTYTSVCLYCRKDLVWGWSVLSQLVGDIFCLVSSICENII